MYIDDVPVLVPFVSLLKYQWLYYLVTDFFYKQYFIPGKPCRKFMLKYDTQNYFRSQKL